MWWKKNKWKVIIPVVVLVLLAGAFLPHIFNIFACAAGLMVIKISVIVKEAFPNIRKGGKE